MSRSKSKSNRDSSTSEKYYLPESSSRTLRRRLLIEHITKICSDSGVCIAFGRYSEDIKQMFDFTSFKHIDVSTKKNPIKRIGAVSLNAFIDEIAYSINIKGLFDEPEYDYKAYAVLKSSREPYLDNLGITRYPDNLLYEFLVGEFINRQNLRFPCFLETYGLFKYKDEETWQNMYNQYHNKGTFKNITQLLFKDAIPYDTACTQPKHLALLIQDLNGMNTLYKKCKENDPNFFNQELLYVLFQIYVPLGLLKFNFTHYDLHWNNVALYTPVKGKYIEYHYHFSESDQVVFKSQYIAKIIDYGRCYFNDENSGISSHKISTNLCQVTECNREKKQTQCGDKNGFYWLRPYPNISSDLILLNQISKLKLPYMISVNNRNIEMKQEINMGLLSGIINNVEDAKEHFIREVTKPESIDANNKYYANNKPVIDKGYLRKLFNTYYPASDADVTNFTSLGQLHIYCNKKDKPMEFIPNDFTEV